MCVHLIILHGVTGISVSMQFFEVIRLMYLQVSGWKIVLSVLYSIVLFWRSSLLYSLASALFMIISTDENSWDRSIGPFYAASSQLIYSILHCVKTLQESLESLTVIATENKTDARVDGTIRDSHEVGDRVTESNATRQSPVPSKEKLEVDYTHGYPAQYKPYHDCNVHL